MKIAKLCLAIGLILLIGCKGTAPKEPENIDETISKLTTPAAKKAFLEKILADDQQVRNGDDAALMLQYGKDSEEVLAYAKAQWQQDELNLQKISKYLAAFGYPKKAELGDDAAMAPWFVIHHATDIGIRNQYFESLYGAYLNGDINADALCMYLARTYEFTFGQRLQMQPPYTVKDEINQLIEALNLK